MATNNQTARREETVPGAAGGTTAGEGAKAKDTLTPVLNNLGPRGIPLPAVIKAGADEKSAPVVVQAASLLMLPSGLSFVRTPEWERAKQLDNVRLLLNERIRGTTAEEWREMPIGQKVLVEMAPVDARNPLGKLEEAKAIDYLADIKDPTVLGFLAEMETRPRVVRAIKAQKETIETKGVKAGEDAGERDTAIGLE